MKTSGQVAYERWAQLDASTFYVAVSWDVLPISERERWEAVARAVRAWMINQQLNGVT